MSWKVIKELNEKAEATFAQAAAIREVARKEDRALSTDEQVKHDKMLADVERIKKDIAEETRSNALAESFDKKANVGRDNSEDRSLGFSKNDMKRYSFLRAVRQIVSNKPLDGIEAEVSAEIAKRSGKQPNGFYLPTESGFYNRAFDTTAATGSIGTTIGGDDTLIEMLRASTLGGQLGVRYLGGLSGKPAFPRQASGATAYWVTEGNAPTTSAAALDNVPLTNKTVGAYTDVTRTTLNQSSIDVENMVKNDLLLTVGLAVDKAIFQGSGSSGQPYGILNTGSIPTSAIGTNGGAETRAHILGQIKTLGEGNAQGEWKYVTTYANLAKMKGIDRGTDTGKYLWADDNTVEGYKAFASNQMPNNLTKGSSSGVCSASIFGNFSEVLVGLWGGVDVSVDPFSLSSSGGIRLVVLQDVDVALRHLASFVVCKDLTT